MDRKALENRDKRYHEGFTKRAANHILVGILIGISYLPFWILYRISDMIYVLLRFVFKYRHKVITENLKYAFPEKTDDEIKRIRNKFYRHFCDLLFESIKMYSISEKELNRRIKFIGLDLGNKIYDEKRSLIVLALHHNNWEWCSSVQTQLKHLILMVYNPIRGNFAMEKFLLHSREKWGGECVPVHRTARTVIQYNAKGIYTGLWLAADQTPPANSKFWTLFLNREAPFFSGYEKIATSSNQPVFLQHARKIKRGRYEVKYTLLYDNPKGMDPKDILLGYIRKSEEIIRNEPEYYLWSHRRWKHQRPEGIKLTT